MTSYPTAADFAGPAGEAARLGLGRAAATLSLRPTVGDLVLFPAWFEHSVEVNCGSGDRISLAFNLRWELVSSAIGT